MEKITKITDERVLSMMIDIKNSIDNHNIIDYVKLQDKHKMTINIVIATLREKGFFIKANHNFLWVADSPTLSTAKKIKELYYEKSRESQKRVKENAEKIALAKKHSESIQKAEEANKKSEEVIIDPLNFEVPLNAFEDLGSTKNDADITISYLQLENEKLKSVIKSVNERVFAIQEEHSNILDKASSNRNKISELESEIKELKNEIESNKLHIKLQNQEFRALSSKNKDAENEIYQLTTGRNSEKKPIRLFGIKIGSIG